MQSAQTTPRIVPVAGKRFVLDGTTGQTYDLNTIGTPGADGASLNPRGDWISGTIYELLDVVRASLAMLGADFICTLMHDSSDARYVPGTGANWQDAWMVLASDGANGSNGADGADSTVPGPPGDDGPNNVTAATTTDLTGILIGNGANVSAVLLTALDFSAVPSSPGTPGTLWNNGGVLCIA